MRVCVYIAEAAVALLCVRVCACVCDSVICVCVCRGEEEEKKEETSKTGVCVYHCVCVCVCVAHVRALHMYVRVCVCVCVCVCVYAPREAMTAVGSRASSQQSGSSHTRILSSSSLLRPFVNFSTVAKRQRAGITMVSVSCDKSCRAVCVSSREMCVSTAVYENVHTLVCWFLFSTAFSLFHE